MTVVLHCTCVSLFSPNHSEPSGVPNVVPDVDAAAARSQRPELEVGAGQEQQRPHGEMGAVEILLGKRR